MQEKYYWLNKDSIEFLERGYLEEGQNAIDRIVEIADAAEKILGIAGFSEKFQDYMSRGFYSLSTPVWMNFGTGRGLGISCFNSHISDSIEDFLIKQSEVGMMTKKGGGTSGFFGDIRARGSKISNGGTAEGAVRCMELFNNVTNIISQGSARRGHFAAYLPIDHGDFDEFMELRSEGSDIQEMSMGITVTDEWIQSMIDGCPEKRSKWAKVIKKRSESGYPYVFFTDNANNNKPQVYKDKDYKINSSNMCSEIFLPSTADESFVCCLSSLNLLNWEEIEQTDAVETLVQFLDAVMTEFIEKTENDKLMIAAHNFAKNHRALGLGVLGWHSFLQSKLIAFESMDAKIWNLNIWKTIRERADKTTEELATLLGEAPILKGYGRRNTTTIAVAPTTSSSFILGQVSPSIEPLNSNYYVKDLAKGKFTYKNPYLLELLEKKDSNTQETWKSILVHGGSVQHLDILSQEEKDVFKTFGEISQKEIVIQAGQRQAYIDQGQSINFMIPADAKIKEINELMIFAWKQGLKSLYYQRSTNPSQQLMRSILSCQSCES
jgi:ribonucleoside-diphosphate reductase alpha chain